MNLKSITVTIQSDGFTIIDGENTIPYGARLRTQFELPGGWVTKDIEFEAAQLPFFLRLFRKRSVFVYTGDTPSRIIVQEVPGGASGQWGTTFARREFVASAFYNTRNFYSYPGYQDPVWGSDDTLPVSLGVTFADPDVPPAPVADIPAGDGVAVPDSAPALPPEPEIVSDDPGATGGVKEDLTQGDLIPGETGGGGELFGSAAVADGGEPNAY